METLPAVTSLAASYVVGFVDGVVRHRLCGWVYDQANPRRRLTVRVSLPSGEHVRVLADRYRADVQALGHGDGHYGFALPVRMLGGQEPVRVSSTDPEVELSLPDNGGGRAEREQVFAVGSYLLQVDGLGGSGWLSGWAVDALRPQMRRKLLLHADNRLAGHQTATLYRPEARNSLWDGYYGFHFALPGGPVGRLRLEDVDMGVTFAIRTWGSCG